MKKPMAGALLIVMCMGLFMSAFPSAHAITHVGTVDSYERAWAYQSGHYAYPTGLYEYKYLYAGINNEVTHEDVYLAVGMNSENINSNGYYNDVTVKLTLHITGGHTYGDIHKGYLGIEVKLYKNGSPVGASQTIPGIYVCYPHYESFTLPWCSLTLTPSDSLDVDVVLFNSVRGYNHCSLSGSIIVDSISIDVYTY